MRKFLAMAALFLGLGLAPLAHAQYSNPSDTVCNAQYSNGIPQQALTMNVTVIPHYTTTGNANEVASIGSSLITAINQGIQIDTPGSALVFTQTSDREGFNVAVNLDFYEDASGTYSIYLEARGLGVGHLFRYWRSGTEVGDVAATVIAELPKYFLHGYTCENTSSIQKPSTILPVVYQTAGAPNIAGNYNGVTCISSDNGQPRESMFIAMTIDATSTTATVTDAMNDTGEYTKNISSAIDWDAAYATFTLNFPDNNIGLQMNLQPIADGGIAGQDVFINLSTKQTSSPDPIGFKPAGTLSLADFARANANVCKE